MKESDLYFHLKRREITISEFLRTKRGIILLILVLLFFHENILKIVIGLLIYYFLFEKFFKYSVEEYLKEEKYIHKSEKGFFKEILEAKNDFRSREGQINFSKKQEYK